MTALLTEIRDLLAALVERKPDAGDVPRFFSVERAAAHSDLSPESIRRLLNAGKLTALRPVRGRVLVDRVQLESYIAGSAQTLRRGRGRRIRAA
jgi:hypothetical protein